MFLVSSARLAHKFSSHSSKLAPKSLLSRYIDYLLATKIPIFAQFNQFSPRVVFFPHRTMGTIAEGVEFDTVAREWRCKWSPDNDKKALVEAQKALKEVIADIQKVDGFKKTDRVVCGGCMDFKVITSLSAEKFGAWTEANFAPEEAFLQKLRAIEGISMVETQTYTIMPVAP
jgi:hypothetical protein